LEGSNVEAVTVDDDLPALELAPNEVVCDVCHFTYHRYQWMCPTCETAW
jgi:hypothetical protein